LVPELAALYNDLDFAKLRLARPSKFVFLCGGTIASNGSTTPVSLRDYLYRIRQLSRRIRGEVVLAEKANQLYRDTHYSDLISFEEDIARIAAVVLVIAESPGSLAELGAFASNETIRKALRIIMRTGHFEQESFIRYGPVQRSKNDGVDFVGVYPWETRATNNVVLISVKPHYSEMIKFVNGHLDAASKTTQFKPTDDTSLFYIIYWVIYLSLAISFAPLANILQILLPTIEHREIRNKIYCMKLAGWIDEFPYSGKSYYFTNGDADPFQYSFKENVVDRDSARRKTDVTIALTKLENAPKHVRSIAAQRRSPS
jgi:hypothetical protein